jgi:hypothetical protein
MKKTTDDANLLFDSIPPRLSIAGKRRTQSWFVAILFIEDHKSNVVCRLAAAGTAAKLGVAARR